MRCWPPATATATAVGRDAGGGGGDGDGAGTGRAGGDKDGVAGSDTSDTTGTTSTTVGDGTQRTTTTLGRGSGGTVGTGPGPGETTTTTGTEPPGDRTPPVIGLLTRDDGDIDAQPGIRCPYPATTTLRAAVSDDTGVGSVVVYWSTERHSGSIKLAADGQGGWPARSGRSSTSRCTSRPSSRCPGPSRRPTSPATGRRRRPPAGGRSASTPARDPADAQAQSLAQTGRRPAGTTRWAGGRGAS